MCQFKHYVLYNELLLICCSSNNCTIAPETLKRLGWALICEMLSTKFLDTLNRSHFSTKIHDFSLLCFFIYRQKNCAVLPRPKIKLRLKGNLSNGNFPTKDRPSGWGRAGTLVAFKLSIRMFLVWISALWVLKGVSSLPYSSVWLLYDWNLYFKFWKFIFFFVKKFFFSNVKKQKLFESFFD